MQGLLLQRSSICQQSLLVTVMIVTPAPHLKQFGEGMDILENSSKNN